MKFLTDVNIEKFLTESLKEMGYDVKSVAEINHMLSDKEIIKIAKSENRIIITNDKDFGELVFNQKETTSGIILFRNINRNKKTLFLKKAINQIKNKEFFITIRKDKIIESVINEK